MIGAAFSLSHREVMARSIVEASAFPPVQVLPFSDSLRAAVLLYQARSRRNMIHRERTRSLK